MNLSVIGSGYVGLITAAGFAEKGHAVICVDIVKEKVDAINNRKAPIYEKGLDEILQKEVGRNLRASMDLKHAVLNSEITFICVGTPSLASGAIDLSYIKESARQIAEILKGKKSFHVVVVKSTVIPGTTGDVVTPLIEKTSGKKAGVDFGIAMNPEFLREGLAVEDFRKPDRIVIGNSDARTMEVLEKLYSDFNSPVVKTDIKTAEMIKYASNAFLAAKISFINEIGNICKKLGIDVYKVSEGMGLDHRIGPHFLRAGPGFGGSCFPKDVKSLIHQSKEVGVNPLILEAVMEVNKKQPLRVIDLAKRKTGSLKGKRVAVLGLAFKGDTDDMRESPAIVIVNALLKEKAIVVAYDPKAMDNARKIYSSKITYAKTSQECLKNADIALIATEWKEFKNLDLSAMKNKTVIDARRMLLHHNQTPGVDYEGLCW
ncbi:MAG: UDP-glucose/GDP-mannose dehydrogenase family protein [Candidatus Altiarchaeales archaeon]|nr:UDP-glucose/GDP-mannose dehydrogenase family protein [Candidatus Altiarchaeales archaeon]